jgi:hypothetical protein
VIVRNEGTIRVCLTVLFQQLQHCVEEEVTFCSLCLRCQSLPVSLVIIGVQQVFSTTIQSQEGREGERKESVKVVSTQVDEFPLKIRSVPHRPGRKKRRAT